VDYTLHYNKLTTDGGYINHAEVKSIGSNPSLNPFYGHHVNSNAASSSLTVLNRKPIDEPIFGMAFRRATSSEQFTETETIEAF